MYDKSYTLKKMLWVPPLLITFFGMAANSFYESAIRHDTIDLYRIVKLSGLASTLAFWALFAVAIGFVLLGILLFFALLQGKRTVILSKSSITVPKLSFGGVKHIEIPLSSIKQLELFQGGNGLFLNIHHSHGKSTLARASFQSESDFQNIHATLLTQTKG
jgi:hypothetical protein